MIFKGKINMLFLLDFSETLIYSALISLFFLLKSNSSFSIIYNVPNFYTSIYIYTSNFLFSSCFKIRHFHEIESFSEMNKINNQAVMNVFSFFSKRISKDFRSVMLIKSSNEDVEMRNWFLPKRVGLFV